MVENVIQLNDPIISELVVAELSLDDELELDEDEDDEEVDEESEGAGCMMIPGFELNIESNGSEIADMSAAVVSAGTAANGSSSSSPSPPNIGLIPIGTSKSLLVLSFNIDNDPPISNV